jgi:hypothetical protein
MKPVTAAVILTALAALPVFQQIYPAAGQPQPEGISARSRTFVVPREYGQFKGVLHDQLLFEDGRGTIRSVYAGGGGVVFTVMRR